MPLPFISSTSTFCSLLLGFEVACFLVAACPLLISANPKGIVIALTTIDTIPITKLVVALFP